jgi:hypothetical protein
MTEVNGLRLAYRGLVAGLAAGYVWLAAAMLGAMIGGGHPLAALQVLGGGASRAEVAAGIGLLQVGAGGIGLAFAYFFARYFTVRSTLAVAGPCFAVLAWLVIAVALGGIGHPMLAGTLLVASGAYGLMLGAGIPLRGEVTRRGPTPAA